MLIARKPRSGGPGDRYNGFGRLDALGGCAIAVTSSSGSTASCESVFAAARTLEGAGKPEGVGNPIRVSSFSSNFCDDDAGTPDTGAGKPEGVGNPIRVSSFSSNFCEEGAGFVETGGGLADFAGGPICVSSSSPRLLCDATARFDVGAGLVDFTGGPGWVSSSSVRSLSEDLGSFGREFSFGREPVRVRLDMGPLSTMNPSSRTH